MTSAEHKSFITTSSGLGGHFAVLMSWNAEDGCYEPWDTGIGRYPTKGQAAEEAVTWAKVEELEYRP